jgi:hypothetical protein
MLHATLRWSPRSRIVSVEPPICVRGCLTGKAQGGKVLYQEQGSMTRTHHFTWSSCIMVRNQSPARRSVLVQSLAIWLDGHLAMPGLRDEVCCS